MADKDTDVHLRDADVKPHETEEIHLENNQKENDSQDTTVLAAKTDEKADSEDTSPQYECELEHPTEGLSLNKEDPGILKEPVENPVSTVKDRGDGQNTETQQESSIIMDCDVPSKEEAVCLPSTCEELDGPPTVSNEGSEVSEQVKTMDSGTVPTEDKKETVEVASENPESQTPVPQETSATEPTLSEKDIETIGPKLEEPTPISEVSSSLKGDKRKYWIAVVLVVLVGVLLQQLLQPESSPQKKEVSPIDIFQREMKKVMIQFPHQREELWKRSKIHLQRHFQITLPTEPVSLILTAGVGAERTLRCLAHSLASALSSALNSSILHIDGASKASQDSDQVKMDIDNQLQTAFKGDKPVAVINRFEELPPASTIIFYRYCDHENAAFKKTFLIFTILLAEEEEIPAKIRLSAVEELVNDHLQKKFLSHGHPTAFDKMDIDKYAGLWSRISHLILPVATEKNIHC